MKDQEPEFLFQGINYLGLLSKQLADLRGMPTLANELIQNADDAKDESGEFSATRMTFDVTDDALVVSNDAVFREIDFNRLQDVAGGSKRREFGDPTTGAFGVGFISVYQITDRPEIRSAGRHWILRPEADENCRIAQYEDPSMNRERGTVFKLPWAFHDSHVRRQLREQAVDRSSLEVFTHELRESIPRAILFLKNVSEINLYRNGSLVMRTRCIRKPGLRIVTCNEATFSFGIIEGSFEGEAEMLRDRYPAIEANRSSVVRLGIPFAAQSEGLFFAALPTQQETGLPFHIDADFYPSSDRRSIALENSYDYRSEWNRAAIRAAAAAFGNSLVTLRDMFSGDPNGFWRLLNNVRQVHVKYKSDSLQPLGAFWEAICPPLSTAPIVYAESGQWIRPMNARITVGIAEREAVTAFRALDIQLVHDSLRRYQNILTSGDVGVSTIGMEDIRKGLKNLGLIGRPQSIPHDLVRTETLQLLWSGIYSIVQRSRQRGASRAGEQFLKECVIAPGLDGQLWPCKAVYRADERTRELLSDLLAGDRSFLSIMNIPLLNELCPLLTPSAAIAELRRLDVNRFEKTWSAGSFQPADLLQWFDEHKGQLTRPLRDKLTLIPIYPSAGHLRPLRDLYLPGGFEDPLRLSGIVEMVELAGLSDFLEFLGAKRLKIGDYAKEYIPRVFAPNSDTSIEDRRDILRVLAMHLGEIENDNDVRTTLSRTRLIECMDQDLRRPKDVYIHGPQVVAIFGELLPYTQNLGYVRDQVRSDSLDHLYKWLGVADRPRKEDVAQLIERLTSHRVDANSRRFSKNILTGLGELFDSFSDYDRQAYEFLKSSAWLTSDDSESQWYRPDDLYAAYHRTLFQSKARFLDISVGAQRRISRFLDYLEVNLVPEPSLVAAHLLQCALDDKSPPGGVYRWLNDRAERADVSVLIDRPCLRVEGKWLRPREVFWGEHPFGSFRYQLNSDFRQYQNLLSALNVRETPDAGDAIDVLQEVGSKLHSDQLSEEIRSIVIHCWTILASALRGEEIDSGVISASLSDIRCIPRTRSNGTESLSKPTSVFFDDGYGTRFQTIKWSVVPRLKDIWTAMEAAGVRPLGHVLSAAILAASNRRDDTGLKELVEERMPLIRSILEKSIPLSAVDRSICELKAIHFRASDELVVQLTVEAFGRSETAEISEEAYLDYSSSVLYCVSQSNDRPWGAVARELIRAIAPVEDSIFLVPVFRMVLESQTQRDAIAELRNCDIQIPEELLVPEGEGTVAKEFDEASSDNETTEDYTESATADNPSPPQQSTHASSPKDIESELADTGETSEVEGSQATKDGHGSPGYHSQSEQPVSFQNVEGATASAPNPEIIVDEGNGHEDPPPTDNRRPQEEPGERNTPFAELFFGVQELNPHAAVDSPATLAVGGPQTMESARRDTEQSGRLGRQGSRVARPRIRWEPTRASADLERKFRDMAHSDYVDRCQVCGNTFKKRSGEDRQTFVVHVVRPSSDDRTNNYGNLLALCGWHYALMQYGEFAFLDPETSQPFEDFHSMRDHILNVQEDDYKSDKAGNSYVGLPVRFWNVYEKWSSEADKMDGKIRYCLPHWAFLCEIFKT